MNLANKIGLFIAAFAMFIGFNSCDGSYDYSYTITNKSNDTITIAIKAYSLDSTFKLKADESKVLFITDHGVEGSGGPYFSDVLTDLDVFLVKKSDTLKSTKDYLENKNWTFNQGNYSTIITDGEFVK